MAKGNGGGRTLSTARHVLEGLEFIGQHPRGVSVKSLARALDLSLSSAYSLMNSLRSEEFVMLSPAGSGLYVLGPKLVGLYKSYVESSLQPERLEPFLEELRDRASTRAYAAIWKDNDLEVVEILGRRGARELQDLSKGFRGAAHALALGKICVATIPERQWPAYLQAPLLKRYTRHTITSRNQLRHNLLAVRQRDLAYDIEEYQEGACCVAAPIREGSGRLVATVGISVPTRRFKYQHATLARVVREIARSSSDALAHDLGIDDRVNSQPSAVTSR